MKRATCILALTGALLLTGCGAFHNGDTTENSTYNDGTGSQPYKPVTHLSHRALITNYYSGQLDVLDTYYSKLTSYTFTVGTEPTNMFSTYDGYYTVVVNGGAGSLSTFDNRGEKIRGTVTPACSGSIKSVALSTTSNKNGYAAVYGCSLGSAYQPGAIIQFDPYDASLTQTIPVPDPTYVALDPAEKHLLVFSDLDNSARWVDLTAADAANNGYPPYYVLDLGSVSLSDPTAAFISSDSKTAYVLSCGSECGGTSTPSVTTIDLSSITAPTSADGMTGTTLTATATQLSVPNGARVGLYSASASKLYVAGSTTMVSSGVQDGYLTVVDLAAGTAGTPIQIGNGKKTKIYNANGTLWVLSTGCGVESCITLVPPSTSATSISPLATEHGDATGVTYASNNGYIYTIEGGELYIYTQSGSPITSEYTTDVKGDAYDVLYIN